MGLGTRTWKPSMVGTRQSIGIHSNPQVETTPAPTDLTLTYLAQWWPSRTSPFFFFTLFSEKGGNEKSTGYKTHIKNLYEKIDRLQAACGLFLWKSQVASKDAWDLVIHIWRIFFVRIWVYLNDAFNFFMLLFTSGFTSCRNKSPNDALSTREVM